MKIQVLEVATENNEILHIEEFEEFEIETAKEFLKEEMEAVSRNYDKVMKIMWRLVPD